YPAFNGANQIGVWRPTPPGKFSMAAPWLGSVVPLAIESTARCPQRPLPSVTSTEYTEAYTEVKTYGSATNSARKPAQNHLARFYGDNFLTQWNRALRDIAVAE